VDGRPRFSVFVGVLTLALLSVGFAVLDRSGVAFCAAASVIVPSAPILAGLLRRERFWEYVAIAEVFLLTIALAAARALLGPNSQWLTLACVLMATLFCGLRAEAIHNRGDLQRVRTTWIAAALTTFVVLCIASAFALREWDAPTVDADALPRVPVEETTAADAAGMAREQGTLCRALQAADTCVFVIANRQCIAVDSDSCVSSLDSYCGPNGRSCRHVELDVHAPPDGSGLIAVRTGANRFFGKDVSPPRLVRYGHLGPVVRRPMWPSRSWLAVCGLGLLAGVSYAAWIVAGTWRRRTRGVSLGPYRMPSEGFGSGPSRLHSKHWRAAAFLLCATTFPTALAVAVALAAG
jgi:hypothetical protein